ncbi:hypothetical protein KC19_6G206700 [Ceratodon purpureus]|uniref:Uncharacterized protein n=1 Tax=Ceratodon purpureus TaxID=3225 RepID=A0A8T0HJR7_CERPU|nr:hypothetical protein KC19_6G206700 [Ceratodon purpureus]
MALQTASVAKLSSLCRTLLPLSSCIQHGNTMGVALKGSFLTQGSECDILSSSSRSACASEARRAWRPVMVRATSSQRWTLDDVERISKGKASKAKTGSRKVPHRLQAGERTAYDLAKKKGYLVQRAVSRKYPLVNTYRNFCDASCRLCIFIQQGPTGADTVVIDLTPLRLSGDALVKIREQVAEVVQSTLQSFSPDGQQADGYSSAEEDSEAEKSGEPSSESSKEDEEEEDANADEESLSILRIETGRSEAKAICQAAWDFWQAHTKTGKVPLAE